MSKTITVSAIIYNGKYDARNTSYFEELTTLPFKEWLKKHNEERQEEQGEDTCIDSADEFDVYTETFSLDGEVV
jgi:hypothetical protein|tara:strand:+ start:650 stop:871 length:222 start_codon:yes stop_codon:yes gene_type:complete